MSRGRFGLALIFIVMSVGCAGIHPRWKDVEFISFHPPRFEKAALEKPVPFLEYSGMFGMNFWVGCEMEQVCTLRLPIGPDYGDEPPGRASEEDVEAFRYWARRMGGDAFLEFSVWGNTKQWYRDVTVYRYEDPGCQPILALRLLPEDPQFLLPPGCPFDKVGDLGRVSPQLDWEGYSLDSFWVMNSLEAYADSSRSLGGNGILYTLDDQMPDLWISAEAIRFLNGDCVR